MKKPNKRSNFFVCSIVRINLFNSIKNPLQLTICTEKASSNCLFHPLGSIGDPLKVFWAPLGVCRGSVTKSVDEKKGMTPARKLGKVMNWDEET